MNHQRPSHVSQSFAACARRGTVWTFWKSRGFRPDLSTTAIVVSFAVLVSIMLGRVCAAEESSDFRAVETQLQELYRNVSPAIVRICHDEKGERRIGVGVVVTPQGHVATISRCILVESVLQKQPLFFFFPDGGHAKGVVRGWSEEWNIAFAKLEGKGEWPNVELNARELRAGEICTAFEFSRLLGNKYEERPSMQIGAITGSASPLWFTTSCRVDDHPPVFSLDGRLIGITTNEPIGREYFNTRAELLCELLESLASGGNLDRIRLRPHDAQGNALGLAKDQGGVVGEPNASAPAPIEVATAATVRIRPFKTEGGWTERGWSGVVISTDGYVATCAHHHRSPGEDVVVHLPDGRDLRGVVLGSNHISDVGLVRITDDAKLPHVEMGNSASVGADAACWLIGYPLRRTEREPLVRKSAVAKTDEPWSCILYTDKNVELFGGDSGGGVFGSDGRLIAIHQGQNPSELGRHGRVELIKREWEFLSAGRVVDVPSAEPLAALRAAFSDLASLRHVVVEMLRNGEPCALGTIVGSDGRILTKASEVYGGVSVRFGSGESVAAMIQKYSRDHDLALLKVEKTDLPIPMWRESNAATPGTLVGVLVPGQASIVGIVSHGVRHIPIDHGGGLAGLQDSADGLKVVDDGWSNNFGLPLRIGDILTSIEGHPTPDLATCITLMGDSNSGGQLILFAGDPMTATVTRGGETLAVHFQKPAATWPRPRNESLRYSGFPSVFDVDLTIGPKLCGGPVFDTNGEVIGVTIACRREWGGQTHVIPASTVRQFLGD